MSDNLTGGTLASSAWPKAAPPVADGGRFVDGATRRLTGNVSSTAPWRKADRSRASTSTWRVSASRASRAWLLERLLRGFAEADRRITVIGFGPERFRGLVNEAHQSNRKLPEPFDENVLASAVALLWRGFGLVTRDLLLYVEMFGAPVLAIRAS